jgi:hypothetical protein
MASDLDNFVLEGTTQGDPVMGTDTMTLGTVTLTGVWSGLSQSTSGEMGGLQPEVSISVVVPSAAGVTLALVGKFGEVKSTRLQCINLDIGEALTTVFFQHATQSIGI